MSKYKGLLYLVGLVIAVPWLTYRISIAGNVDMARQAVQLEKEAVALKAKYAQARTTPVAVVRTSGTLASGAMISGIMNSGAGSRCKVVKYMPYITESRDGLIVHTAELVISGTYTDLVRLIATVESGEYCLISAIFRSIRQRQRKEMQLQMTLILQEIIST